LQTNKLLHVLFVLKEYGADKYYKFKNNPPRHFPLLTFIFAGLYATRELAYASKIRQTLMKNATLMTR